MAEEKKKKNFELVEVTTQTAPAFKDVESGEVLNELQLLLVIANDLKEIKKATT